MKITIPTHNVSDESMGDGWLDQSEAAKAFAAYLTVYLPRRLFDDGIASQGDIIEFHAQRTGDSGLVNNPSAWVEVDGVEDETLCFQVQTIREQLWERFCEVCDPSLYSVVVPTSEQCTGEPG